MTFFSRAMNAVKAYFKRGWRVGDLKHEGKIQPHAHKCLKKIYFTLFCALLSSTIGSFFHLIWDVGGLVTVLTTAGTILVFFTTSPLLVTRRFWLLVTAAFLFGASVGLLTEYLFGIEQGFVFSYLVGTTIGIGTFWLGAKLTTQGSLFIWCQFVSFILIYIWLLIASDIFGGHIAHWIGQVSLVLVCYMGYFVVYSKEVVYDALYEYRMDSVYRAFTHWFHLPAILVHYITVRLAAVIEG
ncbi:hypothetical protein T459_03240 [Capsicum annuum]|uniref:Bax inhibitor 1-like n=1 Tax=Capsicum annuum TaxID=4072 RepID=A0A1U8FFY3_CAPAN|nr:bax inhibitor 1-like [Capsicum annuum]PHT95358.1 hypothetical protein T459_03240 [Capsicum annuum]